MRHHLLKPAGVAAGLAIAVGAAVGTADAQTGAHPAAGSAPPGVAKSRTVFLVTGEKLFTRLSNANQCVGFVSVSVHGNASVHGNGGDNSLRTITVGGS
ncbi:MAG TPA: hypothetical protein VGI74_23600, partial [Streptosporangiaceae bacterium]